MIYMDFMGKLIGFRDDSYGFHGGFMWGFMMIHMDFMGDLMGFHDDSYIDFRGDLSGVS